MALRVCLGCSTAYAIGIQACPQCGTPTRNAIYDWESDVAKASAFGATLFVAEGADVPTDVPDDVRLVGPGAPQDAPEAPEVPAEAPEVEAPAPPPVNAPKADWVEHAAAAGVLPLEEAEDLKKVDLIEAVKAAAEPPPPPSTPEPSSPESSAPADSADADDS